MTLNGESLWQAIWIGVREWWRQLRRQPRRKLLSWYDYRWLVLVLVCGCSTLDPDPFPMPVQDGTVNSTPHGMGLRLGNKQQMRLHQAGVQTPAGWTRPPWINNSGYLTPVQDQGQTPRCTAYALEYLLKAACWRATGTWPAQDLHTPIYGEAWRLDGSGGDGVSLEAALQACTNLDLGIGRFRIRTMPVWDPEHVPYAIHQYGGVLGALNITTAWTQYCRGQIPIAGQYVGPHAQILVGYDDQARTVYGVNSWGRLWGRGGFWEMTQDEFSTEYAYGYVVRITFDTPGDM